MSSLQLQLAASTPLVIGILHTENCFRKLSEERNALASSGIDLLEVRLDGLPSSLQMPKKWPFPVITTARDPKEGGMNHLSLGQRQRLLEAALPWASMIDIEVQSEKEFSRIITLAREQQCDLVLSYHDLQKTPTLAELQNLAARAHNAGASILKVATMTSSKEDLERLLEFQQLPHPLSVATMGMGPLGKISRPLLAAAGSALVYG